RCISKARILGGDEGDVLAAEARVRPSPLARGGERQPRAGMPGDELAQLASRVSAGPENTYRKFMHSECIKLLTDAVNGRHSPPHVLRAILCPWRINESGRRPSARSSIRARSRTRRSSASSSGSEGG